MNTMNHQELREACLRIVWCPIKLMTPDDEEVDLHEAQVGEMRIVNIPKWKKTEIENGINRRRRHPST